VRWVSCQRPVWVSTGPTLLAHEPIAHAPTRHAQSGSFGICCSSRGRSGASVGQQIDPGTRLAVTGLLPLLLLTHEDSEGSYPTGVLLHQGRGRAVAIVLDWNDTYRVSRLHRGRILGTERNVYFDQLDESVWRASCFEDGPFGE
jgi:hypothetical protein